ncbi:hypothetical protein B0H16DRAFT_1724299 [Mycena metata]|uniref:Protein argonaute N-terminal domain-containing protein n=1 Tax=Mycena metata TaxID=1033252 RepID=A0AAD7IXQ6_9AGAR|nr:hypothetical protein B0H16DRAFT_1724299 [Mycena metata]
MTSGLVLSAYLLDGIKPSYLGRRYLPIERLALSPSYLLLLKSIQLQMHPNRSGRGRTQPPPDSHNTNIGRGAPLRGRSLGRGDPLPAADSHRGRGASPQGQRARGRGWRSASRGTDEAQAPLRGRGSHGASSRSRGSSSAGSASGSSVPPAASNPVPPAPAYREPAANVTTIGVRRREYGGVGEARRIEVNLFPTRVARKSVYEYEVPLLSRNFPTDARPGTTLSVRLMKELQNTIRPDIFDPPAVYDGDKKLYALVELDFGDTEGTFIVVIDTMAYTIRLTRTKGTIDTKCVFDQASFSSDLLKVYTPRTPL